MFSDRARLIRYGLIPLLTGLTLVAAYFSGVDPLMNLVARRGQREYGAVENLQNLLLILIAVRAWRAAGLETAPRMRYLGRALSVFAVFVLMEELDWGDHYYRSLTGKQYVEGELFNLHNKGEVNEWTKRIVDAGLVIGFALVPLFLASRFPARLQAWIPDRHSVLTLVTSLLVSKTAHLLEDGGWPNNGAFRNNISEFREIFVYWLAWLYLGEIVLRRRMAQGLQGSTRSEDQDAPAS